jgi:hypothetical protein
MLCRRLSPDAILTHLVRKETFWNVAGQAIVSKITSHDQKEPVTKAEAKAFFDALKDSYNQSNKEQLRSGQQEDAAPVLVFLLHQGNIQEIEFYVTKKHPNDTYEPTTEPSPRTGQFMIVTPTSTVTSMDALVANTLHGDLVDEVNWGNSEENQVVKDRAIMGKKLSRKNYVH